jgi:hypothetical protein
LYPYQALLEAFVKSLNAIFIADHRIFYSQSVLYPIFSNETTNKKVLFFEMTPDEIIRFQEPVRTTAYLVRMRGHCRKRVIYSSVDAISFLGRRALN